MQKTKFNTVDDYLSYFPGEINDKLQSIRKAIKEVAPDAEEVISYNMPAFKQNGIICWYAAHKEHIGFYPAANAIVVFKDELKNFKTSKGAVQFPNETPIPIDLVQNIIRFRIQENLEKIAAKRKKVKSVRLIFQKR
ncbi:MAG: DUF1801 domain-containing protein [Bacteroidales bacterium]|nr:DUF1801 domain-containing protein [Bacteroidales bacterium]